MDRIATVDFSLYQLGRVFSVTDDQLLPLASALVDGLQATGVIYLINTGLPFDQVSTTEEMAQQFFDLNQSYKQPYMVNPLKNIHGYIPLETTAHDRNIFGRLQESKDVFNVLPYDTTAPMPDDLVPSFSDSINKVSGPFSELCLRIMECIALALQLHRNVFDDCLRGLRRGERNPVNRSQIKILSHPALPDNQDYQDYTRCLEHKDMSLITLDVQDSVGGLQIKLPDGEWVDTPPVSNSVVLFTGDMLNVMLSGRIKPVYHRVVIKDKKTAQKCRHGFVYFLVGDDGYVYKSLHTSLGYSQYHRSVNKPCIDVVS